MWCSYHRARTPKLDTDLIMAKRRQCHGVVLQISALLAGVTVGVADLSIQKCTGGPTQQWTLESGLLKSSTYVYPRSIHLTVSGQWTLHAAGPHTIHHRVADLYGRAAGTWRS
jgi:hypothetical protein